MYLVAYAVFVAKKWLLGVSCPLGSLFGYPQLNSLGFRFGLWDEVPLWLFHEQTSFVVFFISNL